jgi:hypothetical protein
LAKKEKENSEAPPSITMSALCCGNCMGEAWEVCLGKDSEGKRDYLIIRCSNKVCVEKVTKQLQEDEDFEVDDSILWKAFEITGQADSADMIYLPSTNGMPSGDGTLN